MGIGKKKNWGVCWDTLMSHGAHVARAQPTAEVLIMRRKCVSMFEKRREEKRRRGEEKCSWHGAMVHGGVHEVEFLFLGERETL